MMFERSEREVEEFVVNLCKVGVYACVLPIHYDEDADDGDEDDDDNGGGDGDAE